MIIANEKNKKTRNGKLKTIKQRYDQVSHHDSVIPFYRFLSPLKGVSCFRYFVKEYSSFEPK